MINLSKASTTHQKLMRKFLLTLILGIFLMTSSVIYPLPAEARVQKSVDAFIDFSQLYSVIKKDITRANTRDACVKTIQEDAFSRVRQRRNVMVFNLSQNYSKNLKNATFKPFICAGSRYGLWTFTSGTFINRGDGGYINWAFAGNYKRTGKDGKTVVFRSARR